jgi:hypothetical protein
MRQQYVTQGSVLVLACTLGSAVILGYVWGRRREWLARRFNRADQIVFVFFGVTAANAVISYPYTKDVIMSPAGVFFAAALTVALGDRLQNARAATVPRAVVTAALVGVLSVSWAVALGAAHAGLRKAAGQTRGEWAYVDAWFEREGQVVSAPAAVALKRRLQDEAIRLHPMRPPLQGDWIEWMLGD